MDRGRELTREISSLLRERRLLKSSIRRLSQQIDSDGATTLLFSRIPNDTTRGSKRRLKEQPNEDAEEDKEPEKRPKLEAQTQNVDGQRRILRTGLLGHLQRARDALAKDREKESTQRQLEKDKEIESKLEQQKQETIKSINEDLRAELESKTQSMKLLEAQLAEKNDQFVKLQLTHHYECMGNYIATKTQPTIFWLPRNFNPELEGLRDTTKQFIAQKLAAIAATEHVSSNMNTD